MKAIGEYYISAALLLDPLNRRVSVDAVKSKTSAAAGNRNLVVQAIAALMKSSVFRDLM
jgi:hypothetical protein